MTASVNPLPSTRFGWDGGSLVLNYEPLMLEMWKPNYPLWSRQTGRRCSGSEDTPLGAGMLPRPPYRLRSVFAALAHVIPAALHFPDPLWGALIRGISTESSKVRTLDGVGPGVEVTQVSTFVAGPDHQP